MTSPANLIGRTAVVTGATGLVGKAVAGGLTAHGANVALVSRDLERLENVSSQLGANARAFAANVSSTDEVDQLARDVLAWRGSPCILVNAVGVFGPIAHVVDSNADEWIATISTNLVGPYLVCRAFAPRMMAHGWGRILNVSSAASLQSPGPLNSAYATSKVALNQFTRHLAAELAGSGVTANVLHPGDLLSDMWADISSKAQSSHAPDFSAWATWVAETGGDAPDKVVDLILETIMADEAVNGEFLWIKDALQRPIQSWSDSSAFLD